MAGINLHESRIENKMTQAVTPKTKLESTSIRGSKAGKQFMSPSSTNQTSLMNNNLETQSFKMGDLQRRQPKSQASSRVRTMNKKYQVPLSRDYSHKYHG